MIENIKLLFAPPKGWTRSEIILAILFPPRHPKAFHVRNDMPDILGYQYRLGRKGTDPRERRGSDGAVVGARIVSVTKGFYVQPGVDPRSNLRYTAEEKPFVAVYPKRIRTDGYKLSHAAKPLQTFEPA